MCNQVLARTNYSCGGGREVARGGDDVATGCRGRGPRCCRHRGLLLGGRCSGGGWEGKRKGLVAVGEGYGGGEVDERGDGEGELLEEGVGCMLVRFETGGQTG